MTDAPDCTELGGVSGSKEQRYPRCDDAVQRLVSKANLRAEQEALQRKFLKKWHISTIEKKNRKGSPDYLYQSTPTSHKTTQLVEGMDDQHVLPVVENTEVADANHLLPGLAAERPGAGAQISFPWKM
ncbi:hypothetical protein MMC15_006070 [Xylographa vitiligo]|nr:hypothetical protein [Xylographa vitiligo]